jgi:hypothetical protein
LLTSVYLAAVVEAVLVYRAVVMEGTEGMAGEAVDAEEM